MILVVGATGLVGSEVCRRLVAQGEQVRALVRETADPRKVHDLEEHTVNIVHGDLRDPASLADACRGVDAVITTVSSMPFSYEPGKNDIDTTDRAGQIALIDAAKEAGAGHFTYLSFSKNLDRDFPLRNAKRAVEAALVASGLRYTILRPSCFMEVWLSPAVGFDFPNRKAVLYGDGTGPIAYITTGDVAQFAVSSLTAPAAWNATLEMGGPRSISQLEAVSIFERLAGTFETQHVPVEALDQQLEAATDPMAKSFAALMRCVADGDPIDMTPLLAALPISLTSVEEYAANVLAPVHAPVG